MPEFVRHFNNFMSARGHKVTPEEALQLLEKMAEKSWLSTIKPDRKIRQLAGFLDQARWANFESGAIFLPLMSDAVSGLAEERAAVAATTRKETVALALNFILGAIYVIVFAVSVCLVISPPRNR